MTRWFRVQQIGYVTRALQADESWVDPFEEVRLVIDRRWEAGLMALEQYSHLIVLCYFDRAKRRRAPGQAQPGEGLASLPPVGFFSTRTPKRPNPIGISTPRLIHRDGNVLIVRGIDAWNATPIIDIKGYSLRDEYHPDATVPEWLTTLWASHDAERPDIS